MRSFQNMMKSRKGTSIRTKLVAVFVVVSVLVFLISGFAYLKINKMIQKIDDVYSSNLQFHECAVALDRVQASLYQYLNTKSSESLEEFYEYEQQYRDLIAGFHTVSTEDSIKLAEKNVYYMSETYLDMTNETIVAKRGRNVTKYKEYYETVEKNYRFLQSNINSMNNLAFTQNANKHAVLRDAMNFQIGVSSAVLGLVMFLSILWIIFMTRSITKPLINLANAANEIARGNMDIDFPFVDTQDEISIMAKTFNKMISSIRAYIQETKENYERESKMIENELIMKNDLKEAQLKYLQAQINPHFLFNSLNAGAQLAMMEGTEKTCRFIQNMADFFRYNVRKMDNDTTLEEELKLIDSYIYILNVRFTGDIHYYKNVDEKLLNTAMPGMILQPIVENAVNHGIREMEGNGVIRLFVCEEKEKVCVRIVDNGKGIDPKTAARIMSGESVHEPGEEAGIGLDNVISRLKRYYDQEHVIDVFRRPEGGTEVRIYLLKERGEENGSDTDM